jgi:predicted MFS family arabinose efflux permease
MWVLLEAGDAPNLAATLNIGAFNIGNALAPGWAAPCWRVAGRWTRCHGPPQR